MPESSSANSSTITPSRNLTATQLYEDKIAPLKERLRKLESMRSKAQTKYNKIPDPTDADWKTYQTDMQVFEDLRTQAEESLGKWERARLSDQSKRDRVDARVSERFYGSSPSHASVSSVAYSLELGRQLTPRPRDNLRSEARAGRDD
jgi:hypothetical protein